MLDTYHFMQWNNACCKFMEWFNGWEELERLSPYRRRYWRNPLFNHRPREWQLEGTDKHPELVPYDIKPVDPRMSAEERSWAIWDGNESTRRHWELEIRRGYGPKHKIRTPKEIKERHRNGL